MVDAGVIRRIYELSHPLNADTIAAPVSRPFELELTHPHAPFDDRTPVSAETILSGTDCMTVGTHTGTHVDAPYHVSRGRSALMPRSMPVPVVARGVLLDFPRHFGVESVDRELTPTDIDSCVASQGTPLRRGDAVLFRTGRDAAYATPDQFMRAPFGGPGVDSAQYLVGLGVSVVGSDTMPFEAVPSEEPLEVHALLLADQQIQIMEMLNLVEIAADGIHEFLFMMAPLRIAQGTGSPVNPLAVVMAPAD